MKVTFLTDALYHEMGEEVELDDELAKELAAKRVVRIGDVVEVEEEPKKAKK